MELSPYIKTEIEKVRSHFPTTQALTLPILNLIQEEQGWVSEESMQAAADYLGLPLMKIKEVATFYTMYRLEKTGKVHLQLCVNISCWLNGSEKLMHCMEKRLGVKCGETTTDGRYTLSEVECLASCGTAPVLQVNEDYYESLSVPELTKLLDQIDGELNQGKLKTGFSTRPQIAGGAHA
jgi:NADH-quinone oxidoreductase subunit E